MNQFQSSEDYLERILMLSGKKAYVHAIDIAKSMNYSKPSVSIALKKLKEKGLITIDELSHIRLTPAGLQIATKIYDRHKTMKELFMLIGVSEKVAEQDACEIEHAVSEETYQAIKKELEKKRNEQ